MEDENDFQDQTTDFNFKLILIGNSQVGKTSIINRYCQDTFDQQEKRSRKVQINHKLFTIPKTKEVAELHCWDTLGQEKFQAISGIFFKGTSGAFLVFDLSRRSSFEDLDKWNTKIKEFCDPKVVVMLIGNKCDLPSREVKYEEGMDYA